MSALKGLAQRPTGEWAFLQVRVSADLADEVKAAARRSGLSYSYYLSTLLEQIYHEAGDRFPIIDESRAELSHNSATRRAA